ncbi:MAG: tandem-95 repeat protein [Gammaproteobacteria bacterium]|nr:tandem-95 repeat protein [Gammaproteobacteria bacterium]
MRNQTLAGWPKRTVTAFFTLLTAALLLATPLRAAQAESSFEALYLSATGWEEPGAVYPMTLNYSVDLSEAAGATISMTLADHTTFDSAAPAPDSGTGTAADPLVWNLAAGAGGKIIVRARANDLTQTPTMVWRDLSASATLSFNAPSATASIASSTLGPKALKDHETARFGVRKFPLVMVEYQDVTHCTGVGQPFPECTGDHTAVKLDHAVNSRTSGESMWQLFQEMSFGQLSPEGQVGPMPNTPNTAYTPGYNYKWSTLAPAGTCAGATTAPPTGEGVPLSPRGRIEDGWYVLPGTQNYYGQDSTGHGAVGALTGVGLLFGIDDACSSTGALAYDAAAIADQELDYNEFDSDRDGLVDFMNVAFAGDGGNLNTSATGLNNVWPHKSDLQYYFTDAEGRRGYVSNDQLRNHEDQLMYWTDITRTEMTTGVTTIPVYVRVGPYNVNPESAIDAVSVVAHEYGHSLGLPDFYSTGGRETFGSWELMASDHFQFMTVFNRQEMGWIVPRPATDGVHTLKESKIDTGTIEWTTEDGTPYTLTGPGIHNADALKVDLPKVRVIDEVPSGTQAWHSGSGNEFGCAPEAGHNFDVYLPEMANYAGSSVELSFQSLYEIEWDWDFAFLQVGVLTETGVEWTALPSLEGTTLDNYNPNGWECYDRNGHGITGASRVDPTERNLLTNPNRATGSMPTPEWITDRFDLSAYAGQEIIIRFTYFTDPAVAFRGWFVDDIKVQAGGDTIYASDFEGDEDGRLFASGWSHVNTSTGRDVDHAYYIEVRDRVSNDFDSKGQSDRGAPTWEPGVAILYTDENHGYGNTGVDNPPAQTIVDAVPDPGNDSPNLDDAAFTADLGRNVFDGCTHVDNYDTPNGLWKLPEGMRLEVDSLSGLSGNGVATGNAQASLTLDVEPRCDFANAGPVLSFGAGHSDPDPDGSYELTWVPTEGTDGPNQLQEATTLAVLLSDDAENDMSNWAVSSEGDSVADQMIEWSNVGTTPKANDNFSFFTSATDDARNASSIMTWASPIAVPATGATVMSFQDSFGGELDDQGFVEVSTDGIRWDNVYTTSNPVLIGLDGTFFDEELVQRQVDLTPYAGENIQLRFRYFVGGSNYLAYTPFGWWVDDVRIDTADWTDIAETTDTSHVRSGLADGHYYYRVRSSHLNGELALYTNWSNVIETDVMFVNQAPVANDDAFTSYQGLTEVFLDVLANDSDPEGGALTITAADNPASQGGLVQLRPASMTASGKTEIYYYPKPKNEYVGTETFAYTVEDDEGNQSTATVAVTVEANRAAVAVDDGEYYTNGSNVIWVERGGSVTIPVLDNDYDPDGDDISIVPDSISGPPDHGNAVINPDGTITYTDDGAENHGGAGTIDCDRFAYFITDGKGDADTRPHADVRVCRHPNRAPTAGNDVATTDENVAVDISVLANDSDPDGDSLTIESVSQGNNGATVTHNGSTVTYTPADGFFGTDTFTYTVTDGELTSNTATVEVTVNEEVSGNNSPVAVADSANTEQGVEVNIDVLANDTDEDAGDTLTVTSVTQPANGSVVNNNDGTVTYTPDADFSGDDTFTYTVSDGQASDSATVTVTVSATPNQEPTPVNDNAETDQDTAVNIDVLANDTDPDSDPLSIANAENGTHGSVVINTDNTVTYTPEDNFVGDDSFTYTVGDGRGGFANAMVFVTVNPVQAENRAPVAENDDAETDEGVAVVIDVLDNDSDPDSDPLTVTSAGPASNGSVATNGSTVTYTPDAGFTGPDSFSYTIEDGRGGSASADVLVTVLEEGANHAPKAKYDKAKTPKNMAVTIFVLTNDKDKDGDELSITEWTQGEHGTVVRNGAGALLYTPHTDYTGKDEFTYTITDGRGGFDTAKVKIKVDKKDKDDDGSSDDDSSHDHGSKDDHSSDDGSSRDDGCSKDADCDGDNDSKDDDDDNDGIPDDQDDDIDGDGIPNAHDSKGHDNVQGQNATISANDALTMPVEISPATASLFVIVRGANADMLQIDILDSAGLPTGVSVTGIGNLTAFVQTFLIGEYSITITNPTSQDIDIEFTTVRQQF